MHENKAFYTPVLFLVFNRPEPTKLVFAEIRKRKPKYLFIAADGPRHNNAQDQIDCLATRKIVDQVDWDCDVKTLFRETNLGCRSAVSSAIDWFFSQVEEGIILEDDCLPDQSFFDFCEALLQKYRDNEKVMHIGGANFQFGKTRGDGSYYFSSISHIWGWATWRRAWQKYDVNMSLFPEFLNQNKIADAFDDKEVQDNWNRNLKKVYKGGNTWDFQWSFANLVNNSFCIIPNENLISNIGFGVKSTSTVNPNELVANLPLGKITEIVHPSEFIRDKEADHFTNTKVFPKIPFTKRAKYKILKIIRNL